MPWKPKPAIAIEREKHELQMRLLKVNSELRLKQLYCEKLEVLVCERNKRIDSLYSQLQLAWQRNRKLENECEHLAAIIANDHRPQTHIGAGLEAP